MSSPRPNWKRERESHAGPLLHPAKNWCPEKCSHLRLFLFREALCYLSYRGMKWRPRSDLNTHRPLRRRLPSFGQGELERANGVEPSRASSATMPRTMRARVLVPRDGLEPPFSANQALVLPLDERGVVVWSGRLDSNQRLLGSGPRCLPG